MRPLRILHVIASSGIGGAERVCATLLAGLDPARFESWVACDGEGPMLDEYRRHASGVTPLALLHPFDPIAAAKTLVALPRLMREFRCDVVHSHLWQADLLTGVAAAVAGVPVRVTTIHGDYFDFVSSRVGWQVRRFLAQRSYRAIYTLFDRVIAVADFVADRLVSAPGYGVRKEAIVRIHTGFDIARLAAARGAADGAGDLRASGPVIVTVGRFSGYKGHRYLVDAMPRVLQRFPDATFLLVGSGTTLPSMQEQVARLGIERSVRFVGESPDALELIAGADVMALSSLSEGLPLALLEAHALGKPIVASAVGGSPELIQDGVTGLLVPPRDPAALADAIIRLLSDATLRRSFGERGRALVRDQFSAATMVEQTERLYLELASSKGVTLDGEDR